MNTNKIIELEEELNKLKAEAEELRVYLQNVDKVTSRLRELVGGFCTRGDIERTRLQIRDEKAGPLCPGENGYRIIDVDDKFVTLRFSGATDTISFRRKDGFPKGSRGDWNHHIDIDSAVAAWEEWCKEKA